MVLGGAGHLLNLRGRETSGQEGVGADYAARVEMVVLASVGEAQVVEGGDAVDHVGLQLRQAPGQLQAPVNDHEGMIAAVCLVEGVVAGQDVAFYVGRDVGADAAGSWVGDGGCVHGRVWSVAVVSWHKVTKSHRFFNRNLAAIAADFVS